MAVANVAIVARSVVAMTNRSGYERAYHCPEQPTRHIGLR